MPRNFFSRSSSKQSLSPSFSEHISSSPPQDRPLSPPSDKASLSDADYISLKPPLPPRWSSPSMKSESNLSLPAKKSAQNSFYRMMSRNRSGTQESTGAETELYISPPSSPTADPSTGRSCGPETKKMYKLPSYLRKGKSYELAQKIEALEGESIASRHNIGTASIDCELHKIEYGQFKERPACLVIVDVRLVNPPDNTIESVKLGLQFGKDDVQNLSPEDPNCAQNPKAPISKVFAPEEIEGIPGYSQKTAHYNIKPKVEGLTFKLDTGGGGSQITSTKEHRWRVQGRREEHNGVYDTFGWNIYQNEISEDSVPRQLRLGMIAFHEHQPFWVNVNIDGSVRHKRRRPNATQGKRWFNPPTSEDVGRHILQEAMVENHVRKQNLLIRDIAPSRAIECKTVNLVNIAEISGGTGSGIDGGGMVTDLASIGDDGLTADSPTMMMDSSLYN